MSAREATTIATGFDDWATRIETGYDDLGRRRTVTQVGDPGSAVRNEVRFSYDGWGNISKVEQDRNSKVGASSSVDDYEISHVYEKATSGRNTIRRSETVLPDGTSVFHRFSTTNHDDAASRVTQVKVGTTTVATGIGGRRTNTVVALIARTIRLRA